MEETLFPLTIPPGVYRDGTTYQSKGRWFSTQLVRFFEKTIRPIGGWMRLTDANASTLATLTGMPRAALSWKNNDSTPLYAFATTSKLMIVSGGSLFDETPAGFTVGAVNASSGNVGTYGNAAYGAGNYGTGATGSIPTDPDTWTLDAFGNFLVAVCTSDQKLYVWQAATGTAAAPAQLGIAHTGTLQTSGSTAAGSSTILLASTTITGALAPGDTFVVSATTYTVQQLATASSNTVLATVVPVTPGIIATATAVTGYTPVVSPTCRAVCVTPEKFLVALGAGDVRTVQWASQATFQVWDPLLSDSAGSFPLATAGRIMSGHATKQETLIWTDADLWRMVYIGGELVYGFIKGGDQCGIIAPNAYSMVDYGAYWMGRNGFYFYNGYVTPLPCDVADAVFPNINDAQRAKIWSMPMPQYGEVWWFYPSVAGIEIDSYVIYNYRENHWAIGTLSRTCGTPSGPIQYPVLLDASGAIWQHDIVGQMHSGAATPSIQSGPIEIGSGDKVMKITRLVPDEKTSGQLSLSVVTQLLPNDPSPVTTTFSSLVPQMDIRVTGRQAQFKFTQVTDGTDWRLGNLRLGGRLGGKR